MLQVRLASFVLKLLFVFIAICFVFSIPSEVLAQCLRPEVTVLSGDGEGTFEAVIKVTDLNDPVNGVLRLEASSYRGDGGTGGIPFSGIPSSIVGSAIITIQVGNPNNIGGVRIDITNSCCQTTRINISNFSSPRGGIHTSIKYLGNTCQAPTIESVLFEKLDGDVLEPNPSLGNEITVNNKKYGGGVRFFPDATSSNPFSADSSPKRNLMVKAKVTPIQANIPIYFRSFDVDDSSGLFNDAAHNGQDNQEG